MVPPRWLVKDLGGLLFSALNAGLTKAQAKAMADRAYKRALEKGDQTKGVTVSVADFVLPAASRARRANRPRVAGSVGRRALGIGGPRRQPQVPDVPTFNEAGLTGFDLTCYHGIWFPAGTPQTIVR